MAGGPEGGRTSQSQPLGDPQGMRPSARRAGFGYRAYRLDAEVDDVRVRVMPAVRLEALARAMDHAREVPREERSERMRD